MFLKWLMIISFLANIMCPVNDIQHKEVDLKTENGPQSIHVLQVDPSNPFIDIKPVLSHDQVFGFETVSAMALRHKAIAAVNGGFFYSFGQPVGMVMVNGNLITVPEGITPVFAITETGKPYIGNIELKMICKIRGISFPVDGINRLPKGEEIILYTQDYGYSTRVNKQATNFIIKEHRLEKIICSNKPVRIPLESKVLVITDGPKKDLTKKHVEIGDNIEFEFFIKPPFKIRHALQTGPWLVKNGRVVVGNWEPIIGVTNVAAPRTALGITGEGKVIFVTVDGRQKHSRGMTLKQLAEYMIQLGVKNGAALDGGASTTFYYDGKVANRPSLGHERMVGGSICVVFPGK